MDQSNCYVISLDVHEDHRTVLILRVNNQWVYVDVHPSDLGSGKVREQYEGLIKAYWQQAKQDGESKEGKTKTIASQSAQDSGYASNADEGDVSSKSEPREDPNQKEDSQQALEDWMLQSLSPICAKLKREQSKDHYSLADWYDTVIRCYSFNVDVNDSAHLTIIPREDVNGRNYIKKHLTPNIHLPKYLRTLKGVPWYKPQDLRVESEANDLHMSIHPKLVSVPNDQIPSNLRELAVPPSRSGAGGKRRRADSSQSQSESSSESQQSSSSAKSRTIYFLKLATPLDASSVKREIRFLHTLQKRNLYSKGLRSPRLAGLVSIPSSNSNCYLLGFLLTLIPQPTTPLTSLMSSSVSCARRTSYATLAKKLVKILHDADLVWGDSKADDFLVDGHGELWMIDFGGSYTPGWVDAELADTVEGDEMGLERIVGGLADPESGVEGGGAIAADEELEVLKERGLVTKPKNGDEPVQCKVAKKRRRIER